MRQNIEHTAGNIFIGAIALGLLLIGFGLGEWSAPKASIKIPSRDFLKLESGELHGWTFNNVSIEVLPPDDSVEIKNAHVETQASTTLP